jgi:DNA-binding NarL/FixJ family response regulator
LAERNYHLAQDLVTSVGDVDMQVNIKGNLATLYSVQKKYAESILINKLALPYLDSLKKQTSLASRYYNIGYSYYKLKKYDSAHVYVDRAIDISHKEGLRRNLTNYYKRKSKIYRKQKKHKEALAAYKIYKIVYDSIYNIRNAEKIKEMLLRKEFQNEQTLDSITYAESEKRLTLQADAQEQRKNLFLLLFVVAVLAIVIGYYAFMTKRKLLRSKLEMTNLQKAMLNERLEAIYKEAEQVLINTKAQTKHRGKIIRQLKAFLKERNSETVFKNIKLLQLELEHQNKKNKKAVALFQDRMQDASIKFEEKLQQQFSGLTKNEREVCSLIRANLSIKEIANVKDVSSAAIQSMRYRIRKKLDVQPGEELTSFLQNL